jgi:hypothetical protein
MRLAFGWVAGMAIVMLGAAGAAAGPYDGTYAGTLMTFTGTSTSSGKGNACTTPAAAPGPLTIANGHAQTRWANGTLEGDVDPSGKLIMRSSMAGRFEGQVDTTGAVRGNYEGYCIYALTWRKRG